MGKTSFILHLDSLCILDKMSNEQAGILLKTIYHYKINDELPELDFAMEMAITPFINQFKRDDENYGKVVEKRKLAGAKGGKQKVANASKSKQKVANLADNDNDSVSDNDNVSKKDSKNKKDFISPTLEEMQAYFLEKGYSKDVAVKVFDYYTELNWHDSKGNPVKNWKSKCMAVWFKPENLIINQPKPKPEKGKPTIDPYYDFLLEKNPYA